jgi:hypothetical protein
MSDLESHLVYAKDFPEKFSVVTDFVAQRGIAGPKFDAPRQARRIRLNIHVRRNALKSLADNRLPFL